MTRLTDIHLYVGVPSLNDGSRWEDTFNLHKSLNLATNLQNILKQPPFHNGKVSKIVVCINVNCI